MHLGGIASVRQLQGDNAPRAAIEIRNFHGRKIGIIDAVLLGEAVTVNDEGVADRARLTRHQRVIPAGKAHYEVIATKRIQRCLSIQNGRDRLSGAAGSNRTGLLFLSRYWREAAMKREAERLQLAKSGYADSQLADPEVPQEPDIEALCAKAARTYDLTRREEDVLRLLVEGRTAPQIAEELVVSPNTVKTHVRNLYRKLGINRRADLACRLES